jgi:tRNA uridine 5-carboxymethylaminomethyl modification enzyme
MNEEKEMLIQISFLIQMLQVLVHQRSCHMTYTSLDVHDILREGFDRSPMFNGGLKVLALDIVLQ